MSSYNYADRLVMHDQENGEVYVRVQDEEGRFRAFTLPADERQAAAQAIAGDDYRVVPADVPHGCQWTDDPDEPCPVCGQKLPEWERELLARESTTTALVEIAEGTWPEAVSDGLTLACAYCGTVPSVDYGVNDEAWSRVVAKADRLGVVCLGCYLVRGGSPSDIEEIQVTRPGETLVAQPIIIYRYPAEPEPDPAAVEALAKKLYAAKAERVGLNRDWSEIGNADRLRHRNEALILIRDHGVQAEVPHA